jgi:hypothetical protein
MMGLRGHGEEIIDVRLLRAFGNLYARKTEGMYQSVWHMSSGKSGGLFGSRASNGVEWRLKGFFRMRSSPTVSAFCHPGKRG